MNKYYKNSKSEIFSFSPIQQVPEGLEELSKKELEAHLNPPPAPVPTMVSRAQGKAALIQAGLWTDVLAAVSAIEDPTEKALAEVALHDATEYRRDSPTLTAIATAIGIDDKQMDELFQQAAQIHL